MHPISVADLCGPTVGPVTFLGFATCIPFLAGPFATWPCHVYFFCNVHLGLRQFLSSFRGIYSPCIEQAVFRTVWDMLYKDSAKMRIHILKSDLAVKLFLTLGTKFRNCSTAPLWMLSFLSE